MTFLLAALWVFGVNLVLSGDNAVLIAAALKTLPAGDKTRAVAIAAGLAAVGLIAVTALAAQWMNLPFVRLGGGLFVLWVAIDLFRGGEATTSEPESAPGLWTAVWLIVAAEVAMSADNVFAAAAISRGNIAVLAVGLGPSVALVVCASGLLSVILRRHPALVLVVGGILGGVAGEMVLTDRFVDAMVTPGPWVRIGVRAGCAGAVVVTGAVIMLRRQLPSRRIHRNV